MSASPQPAPRSPSERERALAERCGQPDAALGRVASDLVRSLETAGTAPDAAALTRSLRRQGAPYVWPHAWTLQGADEADIDQRFSHFLASLVTTGERRCGVAVRERNGRAVVAAVTADALADLAPLPTRVRVGSWISVEGVLLVPADAAKVVVLGPRSAPRPLPTSFHERRVRARFAADAPGRWLVQVLATVEGGPRPVLEAAVFAGVAPAYDAEPAAPGEAVAPTEADPATALYRMLQAARASERLAPLRRDAELDRLAHDHAASMRRAERLGHDVGAGDPTGRLLAAGVAASLAGENVAHAASVVHAHRALWSSPAHRANMLSPHFDSIGIGVVRDAKGSFWVCQLFTRTPPSAGVTPHP